MKYLLTTFSDYIKENQESPIWDEIKLSDDEIGFIIHIYNNDESTGPIADRKNWKNIQPSWAKELISNLSGEKLSDEGIKRQAHILQKLKDVPDYIEN